MNQKEKIELTLKAIASVIAIAGALIAVMKYLDERRKANDTARTESQKPFHTKQQQVYVDLINTTAFLSNWAESPDWPLKEKHFWILYWGVVPMVADELTSKAVNDFANALDEPRDWVAMRNASMNLARACRASLGDSWNVQLRNYARSAEAKKLANTNRGEETIERLEGDKGKNDSEAAD